MCNITKNFKWVKNISKFDESFVKSYNEESDNGCFCEVDIQYPEKLHELMMIYQFYLRG